MTGYDLFAFVVIVFSAMAGWVRGGAREVITFLSFILAALIALIALPVTGPIGRGIFTPDWIGTVLAAAVYLLSTTAVFGAVPNEELAASSAPFAVAAQAMFGDWAGPVVSLVAVISCLGAMNGLILLSGQVPMAAEFDGLAPRLFGNRNRFRAPWTGLIVSGLLAAGFTTLNFTEGDLVAVYAQLLLISTVTTMVPYAFSAAAEMKWLLIDRGSLKVTHFARAMTVAVLALAYTIFAFYGAGETEVYWGFLLILVGIPIYVLILWDRKGEAAPADRA